MNNEERVDMTKPTSPQELIEGLRFLLFRYGRTPSPLIAGRIAGCLDSILSNRQLRVTGEERCTYRQMRTFWRLIAKQG